MSFGETERNQFPKPEESVIPSRSYRLHPEWDDMMNYESAKVWKQVVAPSLFRFPELSWIE